MTRTSSRAGRRRLRATRPATPSHLTGATEPSTSTATAGRLDRHQQHRATAAGSSTTRARAATSPAAPAASPWSTATTSAWATREDTVLTVAGRRPVRRRRARARVRHRLPSRSALDGRRRRLRRRRRDLDDVWEQTTDARGPATSTSRCRRRRGQVRTCRCASTTPAPGRTGGSWTTSSSAAQSTTRCPAAWSSGKSPTPTPRRGVDGATVTSADRPADTRHHRGHAGRPEPGRRLLLDVLARSPASTR